MLSKSNAKLFPLQLKTSEASDLKKLPAVIPPTVAALTFVIFDPLIAAAVPESCAAGKLVRDAPEPLKVVAVTVPVTVMPFEVVSNLLILSQYNSVPPLPKH